MTTSAEQLGRRLWATETNSGIDTVTRLVVQELLEAEQADDLGGRGRYERRGSDQRGSRNGYEPGRIRTAEGAIDVRVPQVRDATETYRSNLMTFLEGNSDVLERLVTEMYARGLWTRDVEDAFRDATGELLISKSAVSGITDQLCEIASGLVCRWLGSGGIWDIAPRWQHAHSHDYGDHLATLNSEEPINDIERHRLKLLRVDLGIDPPPEHDHATRSKRGVDGVAA